MRVGVRGVDVGRPRVRGQRLVHLAFHLQQHAEIVVSLPEGRCQADCLAKVLKRSVVLPSTLEGQRQAVMRERIVWIELERLPESSACFVPFAQREKRFAEVVVRRRRVRPQAQRVGKLPGRLSKIASF